MAGTDGLRIVGGGIWQSGAGADPRGGSHSSHLALRRRKARCERYLAVYAGLYGSKLASARFFSAYGPGNASKWFSIADEVE